MHSLPEDIVNKILSYDSRFIIRNGTVMTLISKNDYRYKLLEYVITRTINEKSMYKNIIKNETIVHNSFMDYHYVYCNIELKICKITYYITINIIESKDSVLYKIKRCKWINDLIIFIIQYQYTINNKNDISNNKSIQKIYFINQII